MLFTLFIIPSSLLLRYSVFLEPFLFVSYFLWHKVLTRFRKQTLLQGLRVERAFLSVDGLDGFIDFEVILLNVSLSPTVVLVLKLRFYLGLGRLRLFSQFWAAGHLLHPVLMHIEVLVSSPSYLLVFSSASTNSYSSTYVWFTVNC